MSSFYNKVKIEIERLVEHFARNQDAYKRADYKEARVRAEFIDPFFEALGWDVHNVQGYAEQYKDVVHEDAIKVGGATRAPDYCFRVGGVRKFFLEAKKPSVSVKGDVGPAYQLRRYAWSAKLPLSILTDFEEFAVYDCRQRPNPDDKASVGRVMYLTFDQYLDHLDDIYGVFAKESVLKGSFDRYVQDTKRKRGTSEVDTEFLKEIEGWRDVLARNIALRNPALSVHELNFAVQRTIDRIIFLRMCEDRGIEEYGRLLALINGPHVYPRLGDLYRQADEKYNAGLFDFQADTLTATLTLDDKVIKPILAGLYYPECPYEFSVLPADVLGQIYEQFLGKVIRLTTGHRAKVEEKPEVKKAGGVYYTPTYIVDYIVKQTVGQLVEGKTPRQIRKLRILDPACGSGSFLLGAYQYLLDYHLRWYEEHDPAKHAQGRQPALYQGPKGEWWLTTTEKKRILLNNIYGVDIDRQAVEVTKLSLLLKVLEGESQETLGQQLTLWQERALPHLGDNIKCGNSLIGPDYFEAQLMPDEEEMRRVNPFDWEAEFPEAMAAGGFDAVIGNPPYVRQESLKEQKRYFQNRYHVYHGVADLYTYFIEKGLNLLKPTGLFGMIVSNKWMRANYAGALRRMLIKEYQIEKIIDFGELPVFHGVGTFPAIIIVQQHKENVHPFLYAPIKELVPSHLEEYVVQLEYQVDLSNADPSKGWALVLPATANLLKKIQEAGVALSTYCGNAVRRGVLTGFNKAFIIDCETRERLVAEDPKSAEILKPLIIGDDVRRYNINFRERYLIFTRRGIDINCYPAIKAYLSRWQARLTPKIRPSDKIGRKPGKYKWYEIQDTVDYHADFEKPKIIFPDIGKESRFAFDRTGLFTTNTVYFIPLDDLYLLGVLGSSLIWFHLMNVCTVMGDAKKGGRLRLFRQFIDCIPIRPINFDDPADVARHDKMVALVEHMLALHRRLAAASIPADKKLYQRQIKATDRQIDALVYELYELTEEEIAIVEDHN